MPHQGGPNSKKKGGRSPAHQNKFAFRHNPGSKKTQKILDAPNVGLCQRCHDKIEWRKQYRKYKVRSQLGKCNLCNQKNIKAAYHTICGQCAYDKSPFTAKPDKKNKKTESPVVVVSEEKSTDLAVTQEAKCQEAVPMQEDESSEACCDQEQESPGDTTSTTIPTATPSTATGEEEENDPTDTDVAPPKGRKLRMCCMCTKDPVMKHGNDDKDDDANQVDMSTLKLRERKTIERNLAKAGEEKAKKDDGEGQEEDDFSLEDYEDEEEESGEESDVAEE
jgi:hypothetical protein